jgi:hypothetical protein
VQEVFGLRRGRRARLRDEHREGDLLPVRRPDRLVATGGRAATRDRRWD